MNLSIIIPAFNEEKFLPATMKAIHRALHVFEEAEWRWEIIVCDNNSKDRTAEVAKKHGATVVFELVNQIGRARNRGASAASGEWLLFIDGDSEPNAELFRATLDRMRDDSILAGGCIMEQDLDDRVLKLLTECWNRFSRTMRWMAGSYIFVRADAFRKVGGFDLKRYAGEEIVLSRSLKKLARKRRQSLVIIAEHRLKTSSRKIRLFSKREQLVFVLRAVIWPLRVIHRPQPYWYDGRR